MGQLINYIIKYISLVGENYILKRSTIKRNISLSKEYLWVKWWNWTEIEVYS
jgi:hypothetical protein